MNATARPLAYRDKAGMVYPYMGDRADANLEVEWIYTKEKAQVAFAAMIADMDSRSARPLEEIPDIPFQEGLAAEVREKFGDSK